MSSRHYPAAIGWCLVAVSAVIYYLCAFQFDAGRSDFYYLADAFMHGRTWLTFAPGPNDVIVIGDRYYVPFAPFPAIVLMPLVWLIGPYQADAWQPIVNSFIAAVDVGLAFWLVGRAGVQGIGSRLWLAVLLGFSTAIWWVTTRGGVWHTGHLIATFLTLCALLEILGKRRAWLIGLLAGAAFLTRAPLAFALPVYAVLVWSPPEGRRWTDVRAWPFEQWIELTIGFLPSIAFFFWYNEARFGSPFESGYAMATLPPFLEALREQGLFSLSHIGMNIDYLFLHLPKPIPDFPYIQPDGLGMSIFLTSPGLLLAILAPWRSGLARWLAVAAVLVLIPTLLYYGGGWLQYGYRYALDSIPFVLLLCALAAARRGLGWVWRGAIVFGVVINAIGVYWAYNI